MECCGTHYSTTPSLHFPFTRPSALQIIQLRRVLAHDLRFECVGDVPALHDFFHRLRKLGVAVVVVGGEDYRSANPS